MLSALSYVDVMIGLWKNIGLTNLQRRPFSVRSLGSQRLGESNPVIGPKDTIDGSTQGKSPCEDNIGKSGRW